MGSKFSRSKKSRKSAHTRGKRVNTMRDQIMSDYAEKVSKKHHQYAKVVKEINKFQPNVKIAV